MGWYASDLVVFFTAFLFCPPSSFSFAAVLGSGSDHTNDRKPKNIHGGGVVLGAYLFLLFSGFWMEWVSLFSFFSSS